MITPDAHTAVLEIFRERAQAEDFGPLDVLEIGREALKRTGGRGRAAEQEILTHYYDLFRSGLLSWGWDLGNARVGHVHATAHGKRSALSSRDPSNKAGYLAGIDVAVPDGTVARSYIDEALDAYRNGCVKATAVLTGAAAEALILEIQRELLARMQALSKPIPAKLKDWRIKTILDGIEEVLDPVQGAMPRPLKERYSTLWGSFAGQLRLARNEAGHPTSIAPVTLDLVHGSLLIFPGLAELAVELRQWIASSYV